MRHTEGQGLDLTIVVHRRSAHWRAASLGCLALFASLEAGCSSADPALLSPDPGTQDAGPVRKDAGGHAAAGGTGGGTGGGIGGMISGGAGGAAGMAGAGGAGGIDASVGCHPNPDRQNEVCREICPELCNDKDDDCDRRIDEADGLCDLDHAISLCRRGACLIVKCAWGFRDCNGQDDDGCEAELASDPSNCGGCGQACNFAHTDEACEDGVCTATGCESGWADCDTTSPNCETQTNTLQDCGGCDTPCAGLDHASPTCAGGSCEVQTCVGNFGDCDQGAANGCETPLDSLSDCGGCDVPCPKASCAGGSCSAVVCAGDTADCDGDEIDCDANLASDLDHCGGCTTVCGFTVADPNAVLACVAGECTAVCDPGRDDCDNDYATGCETTVDSVAQCGACGFDCDVQLAHTSATACNATSFSCEVVDCAPGFADCDGLHATGCETDLHTTENCGGCASLGENETCAGLPQVVTTACGAGDCVVTSCAPGFLDCDAVAANGCERNMTVEGPCAPDTNCTQRSFGGHTYFVCTNPSTWLAARDKCRLQLGGDLATIGAAPENAFLQANAGANVWIGAQDGDVEGLWAWSSQGVPFWLGASGGATLLGGYANWAVGQPSNTGDEDCGELRNADGKWTDLACTLTKPFVCEVTPDECPSDETKGYAGQCGCGTADTDADSDGFAACNDACESDASKRAAGLCGCGVADTNGDGDSQPDCLETCDMDPNKLAPGICGCGVADTNTDGDSQVDCNETCDNDPAKLAPGLCGCGVADTNTDGDSQPDCLETCDNDPAKLAPGLCGCGVADTNTDGDSQPDCLETCDNDPAKLAPGLCGCGVADTNMDGDGQPDCNETCDMDPLKLAPGLCGCGVADTNTDGDSEADCNETCDMDPLKLAPGVCGCGVADTNTDGDSQPDCLETCDMDPLKLAPGACGCGVADTNTDGDSQADCNETCDTDPLKLAPGLCGCGVADTNTDGDSQPDCLETCDNDPAKLAPGMCGCGMPDTDSDGDGYADCIEACDGDPAKQDPGACGCGIADTNTDGDSQADCNETCDTDPAKLTPGACGCGIADTDGDADGTANCVDLCPFDVARTVPPCASCTGAFSNITRADYTYTQDLVIGCNATYDSTGAGGGSFTVFGAGCSGAPTPVVTNGMVVLPVSSMTVSNGFTLKLIGDKPVIFAVNGNATINGTINAGATLSTPGAGGNSTSCAAANNGQIGIIYLNPYTSGSGGGGFRGAGGRGGPGWNTDATNIGGAGGTASGNASLVPLRGGCKGYNGIAGTPSSVYTNSALGGAGGGAVQVSAGGTLTLGASARIAAPGGGGGGATPGNYTSGAGGGSGGAVLLEGQIVQMSGALVTANGGGGGGGRFVANGTAGQDGHINDNTAASGGVATDTVNSSNGGTGGTTSSPTGVNGLNPTGNNYSSGGGGGGAGWVVTNSTSCGAQTVNINNSGGGALTDHQVKLTLGPSDALWSRVQASGNDLRFTDTMGASINYWIERWDYAARTGVVWLKIPVVPAGGQVQLYMNYGTGLPAASNLDGVMIWGDDFSTSSALKWTKLRGGSEWNTSWGWSTCGLSDEGRVYCWGYNGEYALGSGDATNRWLPTRVQLPGTATDMDAGRRNGIARTSDGQVWSWGLNTYNELGDGTATTRATPVKVLGGAAGGTYLTNATEVEAGGIHQFAILTTGELVSWGYNGNGTLGDGTNVQRSAPVKVVSGEKGGGTYLGNVIQVSAAGRSACALLGTGRVLCWGRNDWGQLGKGDASAVDTNFSPTFVHDAAGACAGTDVTCTAADQTGCLANIVEISMDMYNACARDSAGQAYCWGYGANYALGNGSTATSNCPVKVLDNANAVEADGDGVLDTCVSISVGARHGSCVLANGRIVQWGLREEAGTSATYPEVKSGGANDFVKAEAMSLQNCGIRSTGQASCWGRNDYGELGIGTATTYVVPITNIESMTSANLTKWDIDATGMTVSGGQLRTTLGASRIKSKATFDNAAQPVVSETRFRVTTGPTDGLSTNGFWGSTAAAFGLHAAYNNGTTIYYRTNATYNGGYVYGGNYKTDWSRSKMTVGPSGANNAVGVLQRDSDGATTATHSFTQNIAGLPVMLGTRHDDYAPGMSQTGDMSWDHIFVRKYAAVEPVVTLTN